MKEEIIKVVAVVGLITGIVCVSYQIGRDEGVKSVKVPTCQHVIDKTPELIWNDDFESFPAEGGLIRVEIDEEDTIYLGPAE